MNYREPKANIDPDTSKSWLRRALPVALAHRWLLLTSLALSLAGLLIQVQIPNLVRLGIDDALVARTASLQKYFWLIALFAVGQGIVNYLARRYLLKTAYAVEYDLRNIMYQHLVRMPFGFYDRVQSGELMSRSSSDIRAVQMYLTFGPSILVQCTIAVFAFALMLSVNVPLALVAMAALPVVGVLGIYARRSIFPVSWLIQSRLAQVATVVDENTNGVRIVKAFAAEQQQLETLAREADKVRWAYRREASIRSWWSPALENLPRIGLGLVLLLGGWMAIQGKASIGTIVAFNAYVLMLQPPFRMLGMLIMLSQRAAASARRIYEVLDTHSDIADGTVSARLRGEISFENVSFDYPLGTSAISGMSFTVKPGETIAIVGRTGSGKSTIGRLLARYYDVTSGRVLIDGRDVRSFELAGLRDQVGIVPDEPFLFSVSIRDNIAYGRPDAPMEEVIKAAKAAGAHDFIQELSHGYEALVGERGYTLSGGQRQRIAIARALLVNPPILVLDDATSAIDVSVEQRIHSSLKSLLDGRTTLIVAHRLSTIALAHRVLLVSEGRVIADGTHASLLETTPEYGSVLASSLQDDDVASVPLARGSDPQTGVLASGLRGAERGNTA